MFREDPSEDFYLNVDGQKNDVQYFYNVKNLKIPGFAKIGSEDVLGALKVINLARLDSIFWIDTNWCLSDKYVLNQEPRTSEWSIKI